ncbi:MAG: protein-glutamate O-methyltransferase CheR [Rhodospirillaceae bacterium]|nr:protein-glutamate O-methyltransferase CheR [Rhodospirillaceae bacterium]
MGPRDFEFLKDFLQGRSGLVITPDKKYLIDTRLLPVVHSHGLKTIPDVIEILRCGENEILAVDVTEAMTTNESLFFRDDSPFDLFRQQILPMLLERRKDKRKFRIWCAACSSGQEPYSLAMILHQEQNRLAGWKAEIVATDISHDILERARKAIFTQFEVQRGLPVEMLLKHFVQDGDYWQLSDQIRNMVRFEYLNLLESIKSVGKFDVIFCRNVLVYFDLDTKRSVLEGLRSALVNDGALFLGGSESTMGICEDFIPVPDVRGVYRKTECTDSVAG